MKNKDFVAISQHVCPICGDTHTHNTELLIHKHFKPIPEDKRVTGYGLCEEHERLFKAGYLALVGVVHTEGTSRIPFDEANRTGSLIHVKREVFNKIFDATISDELSMVFVSEDVIDLLTGLYEESQLPIE